MGIKKGKTILPYSRLFNHAGKGLQAPTVTFDFKALSASCCSKRLVWTDYQAGVKPGVDAYGAHATALGKCVIQHIWPGLQLPERMPTGPTFPSTFDKFPQTSRRDTRHQINKAFPVDSPSSFESAVECCFGRKIVYFCYPPLDRG